MRAAKDKNFESSIMSINTDKGKLFLFYEKLGYGAYLNR